MKVEAASLEGVYLIKPKIFEDARGYFFESYQHERYRREIGVALEFVQDSYSRSAKGVIRGLHFQTKYPQAKLVQVNCGEVFDVVVDIRRGSPTFGKWCSFLLSEKNHYQVYIPEGFAHGFCVLTEVADIQYKFSNYYSPENECGIVWDDATLQIEWPIDSPKLSERDSKHSSLEEIDQNCLPIFTC
jgi:dTDP-4-dehydrorhamnose 3,5-epimerase